MVQAALQQGQAALSQAEVGSALQIFHNLDELRPVSKQAVWMRGRCLLHISTRHADSDSR